MSVQINLDFGLPITPGRSMVATKMKNISARSKADQRRYFLAVKLRAAANSPKPTKYVQNSGAGIHDGTIPIRSRGVIRCSVPKTASGAATKTHPNKMTLSAPRATVSSFQITTRPATRNANPNTEAQNTRLEDMSFPTSYVEMEGSLQLAGVPEVRVRFSDANLGLRILSTGRLLIESPDR